MDASIVVLKSDWLVCYRFCDEFVRRGIIAGVLWDGVPRITPYVTASQQLQVTFSTLVRLFVGCRTNTNSRMDGMSTNTWYGLVPKLRTYHMLASRFCMPAEVRESGDQLNQPVWSIKKGMRKIEK